MSNYVKHFYYIFISFHQISIIILVFFLNCYYSCEIHLRNRYIVIKFLIKILLFLLKKELILFFSNSTSTRETILVNYDTPKKKISKLQIM